MPSYMGRGRTHAVLNVMNRDDPEAVEEDIKEDVAQKMNIGLTYEEIEEIQNSGVSAEIDGRQINTRDDVNVQCSEDELGKMECIVAVDDVPWF